MLAAVPRGVKLTAAAFVAGNALRSRIRARRASHRSRRVTMSAFHDISGISALRPSKSERAAAAENCLTKPTSGEKLVIKTLVLVVHGVKSKESKGSGELRSIRVAAETRGIELIELVTTHEGHCETLVRECDVATVDAFAVMGGDGTLREGVSGMASKPEEDRRPIFAFPCGTGNNFARDLRLRTLEDCFAAIDRGVVHAVDAVKVTHPGGVTYSVNCVTWGMARDAAETAEGMRFLGPLRYDVAGFWPHQPRPHALVVLDRGLVVHHQVAVPPEQQAKRHRQAQR